MPKEKRLDFDTWDPDYDIPDDPKPITKELVENSPQDDLFYKEEMKNHLENLRRIAMDLKKRQNDYWDDYGDTYNLEELVDFVHKNKEDIVGILKLRANWLVKADRNNWEDDFYKYYDIILDFIKKSQYVISSYNSQIKKLKGD